MKTKLLSLALALTLCLALASCGGGTSKENSQSAEPAPAGTQEQPPAADPAPSESVPEEPSSSGDLGDYHVEIKKAALAKDYEGNPAIIITYSWTNNSEDTTNALTSVAGKAFQDGVQLETAIIMDSDLYDSEASMKDVRPGTALDIQCAYVLTSETSIVEFEMTEWISFSDEMVSMNFDPAALSA